MIFEIEVVNGERRKGAATAARLEGEVHERDDEEKEGEGN